MAPWTFVFVKSIPSIAGYGSVFGTPSQGERNYVDGVFDSWYVIGRLGGFNAENLQVHDAGSDLSWMTYDNDGAESAMPALMHNMGQLEYQNDWGRCWVDLGTSDGVAIDVLINALRGHLWEAVLVTGDAMRLSPMPCEHQPEPSRRLGLAVAITRRGFDDALRMACELGVDAIQPLLCCRCTPQAEHRPERWQTILREAVEQCERLWMPTLHPLQDLDSWMVACPSVAVGVTRAPGLPSLSEWLPQQENTWVWMVVGPEGGWENSELDCFADRSWQAVHLGDSICAVPQRPSEPRWNWCNGGEVSLWMAEVRSLGKVSDATGSPGTTAAEGGYRCRCLPRHGVPGHDPADHPRPVAVPLQR